MTPERQGENTTYSGKQEKAKPDEKPIVVRKKGSVEKRFSRFCADRHHIVDRGKGSRRASQQPATPPTKEGGGGKATELRKRMPELGGGGATFFPICGEGEANALS